MDSKKMEERFNRRDFEWSDSIAKALDRFGIKELRLKQLCIINATLSGLDVLGLMPTGGGKSLTYQLPGFINNGVTIVISPLLSLINDQVLYLNSLNIPAAALTSNSSPMQQFGVVADLEKTHRLKFVFVTPERIVTDAFMATLAHADVQRFVLDECHCLSSWGSDFRPDYTKLGFLKKNFPKVPLLSLTATATDAAKEFIVHTLGLDISSVCVFQSSFNRPNLVYSVVEKSNNVVADMFSSIRNEGFIARTGIIYCFSKKDCELVAAQLNEQFQKFLTFNLKSYQKVLADSGAKPCVRFADYYHAGRNADEKDQIQKLWMDNDIRVIVATIAFGMGINKPDVRYVFHHTLSKSIEGYYQESGRAGRDGKPCVCRVYYSPSDKGKLQFIISDQTKNNEARAQKNYGDVSQDTIDAQLAALRTMIDYCTNKSECRRRIQLKYFGEDFTVADCKGTCDNCASTRQKAITSFFNAAPQGYLKRSSPENDDDE